MAANRGLVGAVALAVLVWGVAFGGGLTAAVLTSSVDVTTTFETTDNLTAIDASSGGGFAAATAPVGNETGEGEQVENGTAPPANDTAPPGNDTAPPGNASVPTENTSVPTDDPTTNESAPPEDESAPSENSSAPSGDETVPGDESAPSENSSAPPEDETATDTDDPAPSASDPTGNATAETAPALRGDTPEPVSSAVLRSVGLPSLFASEA